jgi:transcriptional regulator of met regulon
MTDEQKLVITYLSLLILQDRLPFALRSINLIHSQVMSKLVCHANLLKLYGICLKTNKDRLKDAFELFGRAKKIFRLVGGENNKANLGVAQCYLIQATLLRTKSEQIFTHK